MRTTLKIVLPLIVSVAAVSLFFAAYQVRTEKEVPGPIYAFPLHRGGGVVGALALFHDTSYIDRQVSRTLRDSLLNALVQTILITGLALILVRWTFTGPLTRTANWLRTLRTGQASAGAAVAKGEILDQLNHEVTHLAKDLNTARALAQEEARLRESSASIWTAEP